MVVAWYEQAACIAYPTQSNHLCLNCSFFMFKTLKELSYLINDHHLVDGHDHRLNDGHSCVYMATELATNFVAKHEFVANLLPISHISTV